MLYKWTITFKSCRNFVLLRYQPIFWVIFIRIVLWHWKKASDHRFACMIHDTVGSDLQFDLAHSVASILLLSQLMQPLHTSFNDQTRTETFPFWLWFSCRSLVVIYPPRSQSVLSVRLPRDKWCVFWRYYVVCLCFAAAGEGSHTYSSQKMHDFTWLILIDNKLSGRTR